MKDWMETTNPATANVSYKRDWLKLRTDKSVSPGSIWVFTDGSTSGWHSATLLVPGSHYRSVARFSEPTPTRNVGAEVNALLLAIEILEEGATALVVHDYLGVGAWTIGAWELRNDEIRGKIERARGIISDRKLDLSFIHHPGHQDKGKNKDLSDFTKWNCYTDRLCDGKVAVDSINAWSPS